MLYALYNKRNEKVLTITSFSETNALSIFERPNFYGIFFFTNADGVLVMDEQQIKIEKHNILFYYPYQKVMIKGRFNGTFIQFHPDFFCIDIHARDIGCQGVLFNNFFNDFLLRCSKNEFEELLSFKELMKCELLKKEVGQMDMVSSQLKIFLIHAVRIKKRNKAQELTSKDNLHHQIEKLIQDNFVIEASPEFYYKQLDVSATTFNRLCKKYFQNNFVTILHLKKIALAKNKLFLTNTPIKEIAFQIGFNDPLYFSRIFKKYCEVSPKEFRKQLKTNRLI